MTELTSGIADLAEADAVSKVGKATHGSGSVAHQIIGEFLTDLAKEEGFAQTAEELKKVVFSGKYNEAQLRTAMFGEDTL